jgi:hypothetical protein
MSESAEDHSDTERSSADVSQVKLHVSESAQKLIRPQQQFIRPSALASDECTQFNRLVEELRLGTRPELVRAQALVGTDHMDLNALSGMLGRKSTKAK